MGDMVPPTVTHALFARFKECQTWNPTVKKTPIVVAFFGRWSVGAVEELCVVLAGQLTDR
ncbi:hypothetical protein GCM10009720_01900 [Yaniella flava]|uniref:Uncharacterized protein n=1 Tax=Yaniella flava TaxID=287930 RepID=A0ABN2U1U8_9MICC